MPPNPVILTEAGRRRSEGEWKAPDACFPQPCRIREFLPFSAFCSFAETKPGTLRGKNTRVKRGISINLVKDLFEVF
jgi:hypothetical protein